MATDPPSSSDPNPGRAVFDGLPVPVCLVDADGRLVALNRSARSFWEVEAATVQGQPTMQALTPGPRSQRQGPDPGFSAAPGRRLAK